MFIDADKTGYETYYELASSCSAPAASFSSTTCSGAGRWPMKATLRTTRSPCRALARKIHDDERVDMTLATIGDGLSIIVKR